MMTTKYYKINSIQNKHIKLLVKLKEKKYRKKLNLALIEGWHIIEESLQQKILVEILVTSLNKLKLKNISNILITICSESILTKLSQNKNNFNAIGVIDLNKLNNKNHFNINKNILLLENIQDPGNLGTLIRTGMGFEFSNIILYKNTVDIFNSKVLQASQGAIFRTFIKEFNFEEIKILQLKQYKIITTNLKQKSVFLQEHKFNKAEKYILVLGNEGRGLSDDFKKISNYNIKIRISSKLESLNVAQAGAILMYEINNQMEKKNV